MIDVHCHLNFHSFTEDYEEVIKRAQSAGVTKIINVGTKLDSSEHAVRLAETYEDLWAIVGVHPHHADKIGVPKNDHTDSVEGGENPPKDWLKQLEKLAKHPKVIGIGECGMDYYHYASNGIVESALQREVFEAQIELAHQLDLPLQIHHRQVGKELIEILTHHKNLLRQVPGMFHCFAGNEEFLRSALELGFYIGFDGNITYPGIAKGETTSLPDLAKIVPLERLVTETDSPFLTPFPHRGTRNEPQYVILVGRFLAELKHVSFETVVEQTTKNVYTIFTKLQS